LPPAPGEIESIEPLSAHICIEEYELFRSHEFQQWLAAQQLDVIGLRSLREKLRARLAVATRWRQFGN
jgi:hypothetical protein